MLRLGFALLVSAFVALGWSGSALARGGGLPVGALPGKTVGTVTNTVGGAAGSTVGTVTNTVGDAAGNTVGTVTNTVSDVTNTVGDVTSNVTDTVTDTIHNTTDTVGGVLDQTVSQLPTEVDGVDSVGRPQAQASRAIMRDPTGARAVRGRVLALSPSPQALSRARALSFEVVGEDALPSLGLRVISLRIPADLDTNAALAVLRAGDPGGAYDYDHVYDPSGAAPSAQAAGAASAMRPLGVAGPIGMIDGGVLTTHPVLASSQIATLNCARQGASPPSEHGTEVASLLVGYGGGFSGAAPGATLYVADVFGGLPTGGDAVAIARALGWLADQRTSTINVSLVGPPNRIVEAAVKGALARGTVIVAAVGNGGAAGRVQYPAGYRGVVGVTSVDDTNAAQIDANRGQDVAFAARGVEVPAATLSGRLTTVTGTSYAVPIVTARFAREMPHPDRTAAAAVLARLRSQTVDLGAPGWDPVYGYGLIEGRGQPMTAGPVSAQ